MFGISMWEMGLIILVGLIFLGPRQLTETARVVGKLFREIQRMAVDVKDSIDLDAPPSKSRNYEPAKTAPDTAPAPTINKESLKLTGEKSGPDFYAELLENSIEDDPKSARKEKEVTPDAQFKGARDATDSIPVDKKS